MPSFDATRAECRVFAYKEGLLSAVGHDVLLRVGKLTLESGPEGVVGTFDTGSLTVLNALKHGVENPGALSDKDKRTVEGYVREDILHSRRYPRVEFRSTAVTLHGDGAEVEGDLTLHGRTRSVTAKLERRGDRWVTRVRLHQPDFGITPFKAMLGALKIQPHVDVELSVPVDAL